MLFEQVISGLAVGCVYGLVALGFSMIFAAFRIAHFAQGDFLMLGAVFGLIATKVLGTYFVPVLLATIVIVAFVGILVERFVYRKIINESMGHKIMCTFMVGIAIQNLVLVLWGGRPQSFPHGGFGYPSVAIYGREFPSVYILILGVTFALVFILWLLLHRTKLGLGMRATAYSHELSELMGVDTAVTLRVTFGVGSAMAGAGGLLIGQLIVVSFSMGVVIGLKGFIAAVIGGMGNIYGAVLGGLILGLMENLGAGFVSSGYKDLIAYVALILVLVIRPTGLFGRWIEIRV